MYLTLEQKLNNLRNIDIDDMEAVLDAHTSHIIREHFNVPPEKFTEVFVQPIFVAEKNMYTYKTNNGSFYSDKDQIPDSLKEEVCSYIKANIDELEDRLSDPDDKMTGFRINGNTSLPGIVVSFDEQNGTLKYSQTEGFGLGISKSYSSNLSGLKAQTLFNNKPKNEESYHIKIEEYFNAHSQISDLQKYAFIKNHNKPNNIKMTFRKNRDYNNKLNLKVEDIQDGFMFKISISENGRMEGLLHNPALGEKFYSANSESWKEKLGKFPEAEKLWNQIKKEYQYIQNKEIEKIFPNRDNKKMKEDSQKYIEKYGNPEVKHMTSTANEKLNSLGFNSKTNNGKSKVIIVNRQKN